MLPIFTQCERLSLEPQVGVQHISSAGIQSQDEAQEADRSIKTLAVAVPNGVYERGSMDFMNDHISDRRSFRLFNVIADYNREGLTIDVDFSLPSARVIRALDQVIEWRGKPQRLRCDNGP